MSKIRIALVALFSVLVLANAYFVYVDIHYYHLSGGYWFAAIAQAQLVLAFTVFIARLFVISKERP